MLERRESLRKCVEMEVTCQSIEEPWVKHVGRSFDISQGGIGLVVKKHFGGYKRLRVSITNPFHGEPIVARGRVVWETGIPDEDEKKLGVEFSDISRARIGQLINAF